jgi:cell division protein DivIC
MRRKRRTRKKNRTGLYAVMLVVGIFLTTLVVQGISLHNNCQKLATEQSELEEKKKSLEQEKKEIEEQEEYSKTDEYVEEIAREKFGLVYDNEIIFKPEE